MMLAQPVVHQALKFGLVGVVNTAIGFGCIVAMTFLGSTPVVANMLGYAVGLVSSYILNSLYTFNAEKGIGSPRRAARFLAVFLFCWMCNVILLGVLVPILPVLVAQAGAMALYTVLFFILSRIFVFRSSSPTDTGKYS